MIGINFEKNSRSKNKEQSYIQEQLEEYDKQKDCDKETADSSSPSKKTKLTNYQDSKNRIEVKDKIKETLAMPPGIDKEEAVLKLKDIFSEQQRGLGTLKEELFKEINKNENVDAEKIEEIIKRIDDQYNFSQKQLTIIYLMVKDFLKKNEVINKLYNNYFQNPSNLYKKIYNIEPVGKIDLRKGPISLILICHDENDYARMYFNDTSGRREIREEDKKKALTSGGFFLCSYPGNFPELKGSFVGVRRSIYERSNKETIDHEKQHAINKVYLDNIRLRRYNNYSPPLFSILSINNKEQREEALSFYCHQLVNEASERAKDEILAFKTDPRERTERIALFLTKKEEDQGSYDYFHINKVINKITNDTKNLCFSEQDQKETINLTREILENKYHQLIEGGLKSFENIKERGYSHEFITALLMPQALKDWPKVVSRFIQLNIHPNHHNQIQNIITFEELEIIDNINNKKSL